MEYSQDSRRVRKIISCQIVNEEETLKVVEGDEKRLSINVLTFLLNSFSPVNLNPCCKILTCYKDLDRRYIKYWHQLSIPHKNCYKWHWLIKFYFNTDRQLIVLQCESSINFPHWFVEFRTVQFRAGKYNILIYSALLYPEGGGLTFTKIWRIISNLTWRQRPINFR